MEKNGKKWKKWKKMKKMEKMEKNEKNGKKWKNIEKLYYTKKIKILLFKKKFYKNSYNIKGVL